MLRCQVLLLFLLLICACCITNGEEKEVKFFSELNQKDYAAYMQSVIEELEADKEFKDKILDKNNSVSSEDYTAAFEFASSSTRNKLDEIKRREIERLNLAKLELKKMVKKNFNFNKIERDQTVQRLTEGDKDHLHSMDTTQFTKEDFERLISQIKHDLQLVDEAREKQYRRHEWKKDLKIEKELENIKDPIDKSKRLEELKRARSHSNHKTINEPGSESHMKELWTAEDKLDSSYFDLKTFFNLHDLNQDGNWDIEEVESMITPEILKIYQGINKTEDSEEMYHEIMKMRLHFMDKMDSDNDEIITYNEYLEYSKKVEFKENKEWKLTEELGNVSYSKEDVETFEKELKSATKI